MSLGQRKAPLRRKSQLKRSGFMRSKHPGKLWPSQINPKPMRKMSKKQSKKLRSYYEIRVGFLQNHPVCAVCLMVQLESKPQASTEVHHLRGRNGPLLCDVRGFVPTCRSHREWPHENTVKARELGLLAEAADWGVGFDRQPDRLKRSQK